MYDGFRLVQLDEQHEEEAARIQVLAEYKQHSSIAYGADWSYTPLKANTSSNSDNNNSSSSGSDESNKVGEGGEETEEESVIATCSFYDKLLHVWSVNLEQLIAQHTSKRKQEKEK
jgi:hypothetical protein